MSYVNLVAGADFDWDLNRKRAATANVDERSNACQFWSSKKMLT